MPMKYRCDFCDVETERNYVTERLKTLLDVGGVTVECEVMVVINGHWNGGIICKECLRKALNSEEVRK